MDIQRAINHLVSLGFSLPYGVMPGTVPGGLNADFDEPRWLRYQWNPPEGLAHLPEFAEPEPEAFAKFSWRQIVWADGAGELRETRLACLQQLDQLATARIAGLYHPDAARDRNKEWQVRLSGKDLTAHDAQRARIIEVYGTLKADIMSASTLVELREIEGRRDAAGLGPAIDH